MTYFRVIHIAAADFVVVAFNSFSTLYTVVVCTNFLILTLGMHHMEFVN